jgi:hypothetical protein
MCNCGKKRATLNKQNLSNSTNVSSMNTPSALTNPKFEYTGSSSLTVIGSSTGSKYHFKYQGHILEVKHSDIMLMTGVPTLKRIQ